MNTTMDCRRMIGLDVLAEKNTIIFDILTRIYESKKLKRYNVLEIGCGSGMFARQMSLFFKKYDTHQYILKSCNDRYIEGGYNRFYVIKNIIPIVA